MSENQEKSFHNLAGRLDSRVTIMAGLSEYVASILGVSPRLSSNLKKALENPKKQVEQILPSTNTSQDTKNPQ